MKTSTATSSTNVEETDPVAQERRNGMFAIPPGTAFFLVFLWFTSLFEVYFPECMKLNKMPMRTDWMFLANGLGNAVVGFLPTETSVFRANWLAVALPALCDISSQVFLLGGMAMAGSQLKSILYNSCIIFSAVFAKFLVGKILTYKQWFFIAVLLIGLILSKPPQGGVGGGVDMGTGVGMILILIGCALHSVTNVVNERLIRRSNMIPQHVCTIIGCISVLVWVVLHIFGIVIPELVDGKIVFMGEVHLSQVTTADNHPAVPFRSGVAFVGFVLSSAAHAVAYFLLLGDVGVVSCGIVKGATTGGYIILSSIIFASVPGMGLTPQKLFSCAVCVGGVIGYSVASMQAQRGNAARNTIVESFHSFGRQISGQSAARSISEVEMGRALAPSKIIGA